MKLKSIKMMESSKEKKKEQLKAPPHLSDMVLGLL